MDSTSDNMNKLLIASVLAGLLSSSGCLSKSSNSDVSKLVVDNACQYGFIHAVNTYRSRDLSADEVSLIIQDSKNECAVYVGRILSPTEEK
jgi:hypothetical protein